MVWFTLLKRLLSGETRPDGAEHLFIGLGNIGSRYAATRHNVGFCIVDALTERLENRKIGVFAQADYCLGTLFNNKKVITVKPHTFMNRSGTAVAAYLDALDCPLSRTLVIVDDFHMPLGSLRARRGGSDGGHNGLASIVSKTGEHFPRLRVGIGPLPAAVPSIEFVLGAFTKAEQDLFGKVIPRAVEACICFAQQGIEEVMNRYNR
jgi:peptidyl-tRNA hydrolase, PTH1 family